MRCVCIPPLLLIPLFLSSAAAHAGPAAQPGAPRPLAIDIRNATLHNVVSQMAAASETRMRVEPDLGDERVTLYAPRTNVEEFQRAVATLFGFRWRKEGGADAPVSTLETDPEFTARVLALQRRQLDHFLRRLRETASAMASANAEAAVRQVREEFRRRHPEVDAEVLEDLNADFLRQSLLITPLPLSRQEQLVRAGWASLPFFWLSAPHQELLARFAAHGGLRERLGQPRGAGDVSLPNSRASYRLLYGDRWTDTVLWIQIGAPGNWATAILPSILFRSQDASEAYPQVRQRPNDPDVWRQTPGRFDLTGKSWEAILADLSAAMKIKIASDSYLRPPVFDPNAATRPIAGLPLRIALDYLTQDRGMFWWKEDDWYYFRSRTCFEESRVAVPDRLLVRWTRAIRHTGRLTGADLDEMGSLSEEQLITLNLMARAATQPAPHIAAFDPNKASLAATSLLLFRSLTPVQREQAFSSDGLPALWMTPSQQNLYTAVATEYGYVLDPDEAERWGFSVEQAWNAPPATQPVNGRVRFRWSFGPGLEETADLALSDALMLKAEAEKGR